MNLRAVTLDETRWLVPVAHMPMPSKPGDEWTIRSRKARA